MICIYVDQIGVLRELHTDQGANFDSELCTLPGIYKTYTADRNSKINGLVERQNKTLDKVVSKDGC